MESVQAKIVATGPEAVTTTKLKSKSKWIYVVIAIIVIVFVILIFRNLSNSKASDSFRRKQWEDGSEVKTKTKNESTTYAASKYKYELPRPGPIPKPLGVWSSPQPPPAVHPRPPMNPQNPSAALKPVFVPQPYSKNSQFSTYSQSQSKVAGASISHANAKRSHSWMVNANQVRDKVENEKADVVVAFLSTGCGHCTEIKPKLEKVAASNTVIPVIGIDISEPGNQSMLQRYPIVGIPTLLKFKDGRVVEEYKGDRSIESLLQFASS